MFGMALAPLVIGEAWALGPFQKVDGTILAPREDTIFDDPIKGPLAWEAKDVFNPAAVVKDGKLYLLYRAEDKVGKYLGTSRVGLAWSTDGRHFDRSAKPVLYPEPGPFLKYDQEGGCEDPRVVRSPDGTFVMYYSAWSGVWPKLSVATSKDLRHWQKHGPALEGRWGRVWSKSGAVVSERIGEEIVAKKIDGRYWMYFGDTDIFVATSEDLIHWRVIESEGGRFQAMKPRPYEWDSQLVEPGPFALVRPEGIVLIYNGANSLRPEFADPTRAPLTYALGQALFDIDDPSRLIGRLDQPFLEPDRPQEFQGQVKDTVFCEGLAPFKNEWVLVFGMGDSTIGIATAPLD